MTALDIFHPLTLGFAALGMFGGIYVISKEIIGLWIENRRRREQEAAKEREASDLLRESVETLVLYTRAKYTMDVLGPPNSSRDWTSEQFAGWRNAREKMDRAEGRLRNVLRRMGHDE